MDKWLTTLIINHLFIFSAYFVRALPTLELGEMSQTTVQLSEFPQPA